jgi:peptidoglycan-associated lipoprotein
MKRLLCLLVLPLAIAACSTTPPAAPPAAPAPPPAPVAAAAPPPPAAKPTPVAPQEPPEQVFERERAAVAGKSTFFRLDDASVARDQEPAIEAHAELAKSFVRDRILLQGNCDERGGREYNLALGQRRADAVKSRLELLGVPAARIETISFGKEKPRARCHEEKCWSENRRVDFVETWQ